MHESAYITSSNNDLVTWAFIFIFGVLCILNIFYSKRLLFTNVFFLSEKYVALFYSKDKKNSFKNRYDFFLFFLINILTFLLVLHCIFFKKNIDFDRFIVITLTTIGYVFFDYFLKQFLSIIFNFKATQHKISYLKIGYFNNIILWILPFLIFYFYTNTFQEVTRTVIIFLLVFLFILRYIFIILKNKILITSHFFYFILYLCTLEIAPLIFFIKWATWLNIELI